MSMQVQERLKWTVPFPTINGVRQMAHSVVGRLGCSILGELTGGWAGRETVRRVLTDIGGYIAPSVVPLFNEQNLILGEVIAMTALALKVKNFNKQIAIALGVTLVVTHLAFEQYPDWTKEGAESFGGTVQKITSLFGENLGGFIGLTVAGIVFNRSGIVYWDRERPEDGYAVSMARYQIAGIYDQIINPKLFILKAPCMLGGVVCKTAAYNSNVLIPFLQRLVALIQKKESPKKILEPLVIQMISRRFFSSTSTPLRQDRFYLIFSDFFKEVVKTLVAQTPANKAYKVATDELVTRLLLRSFKGYVALVRNTPEIVSAHREFMESFEDPLKADLLKFCIQEQVRKSPTLTKVVRNKVVDLAFPDEKLEKITAEFINEIVKMEREFWGTGLLTDKNKFLLKKLLPIHLKFFVNYMCLHFSRLTHASLEECEDVQLMLELNHLILSGYFGLILPKRVHGRLDAVSHSASIYVADLRRTAGVLIHRNEQSSALKEPLVALNDVYCPVPERKEAEIASLKKELAFFKALDAQSAKLGDSQIVMNDVYYPIPDAAKVKEETVQREEALLKKEQAEPSTVANPSIQIVEGYDIIRGKDEKN